MDQTYDAGPSCFITGATGGLGRALAAAFCAAGYRTIVSGRDPEALDRLVADLTALGQAVGIPGDLTDSAAIERLAAEVGALTTRLDVVVANAGQASGGSFLTPEESLARWHEMILVNVFGAAAIARVMMPLLVNGQGSLFFIGSVTGRSLVGGDLYSVTKHAVSALAEAVRLEVEPVGVRVCVVQPGLMDTPLVSPSRRSRPMMSPRDVADEIVGLARADRTIQVNEVVLRPRSVSPRPAASVAAIAT